jgi:DNA-binding NarL/FixJ family response regulator
MAVRVLIVDDNAAFRGFAHALLDAEGFEVVGEAADAASAIAAVVRLRPDVVVLDIQLPGDDGFAVAERIARERDPPKVVLVSTRDASAYRRRLKSARADGFLAKGELSGPALATLVG